MIDKASQQLFEHFSQNTDPALWLLSDGQSDVIDLLAPYNERVFVLTNRFDIHSKAQNQNIKSTFSDWCLADAYTSHNPTSKLNTQSNSLTPLNFYLKINKEKPINFYLLNQCANQLNKEQKLIVAGEKNEGIKGLVKEASNLFGCKTTTHKNKDVYWAELSNNNPETTSKLNDRNYTQLQVIASLKGKNVLSKPGLYGWNKIDNGSAFLVETLEAYSANYFEQQDEPSELAVLDLGCGYGYLSLACDFLPTRYWLATDSCAAAITACKANTNAWGINAEVVADDCAAGVSSKFDLILCNPPFHSGFDTSGALTDKFLEQSARRLKPQGKAFYVVNAFIPLESKAKNYFKNIRVIADNRQFKVVTLAL